MIIGVDVDEVVADCFPAYLAFFNQRFSTQFHKAQFDRPKFSEILGITKEESHAALVAFFEMGHLEKIPSMPGAKEMVARLARAHQLHAISYRSAMFGSTTKSWIASRFENHFQEVYCFGSETGLESTRKKVSVCQEIGATYMFEDHPVTAEECAAEGIHVLLFDQPWNRHMAENPLITRVSSWHDEAIYQLCHL